MISKILNHKERLEYLALNEQFGVYRITRLPAHEINTELSSPKSSRISEGFASLSDLELYENDHPSYGSVLVCRGQVRPYFAPATFSADLLKMGFGLLSYSQYNPENRKPFSALESGHYSLDDLYWVNESRKLVMDKNGVALPMRIRFDMHELPLKFGHVDIEQAKAILSQNPLVHIFESNYFDKKKAQLSFYYQMTSAQAQAIYRQFLSQVDKLENADYRPITWPLALLERDDLGLIANNALTLHEAQAA